MKKSVSILGTGPSWTQAPLMCEETWGPLPCLVCDGLKDKKFTKVFSFDGIPNTSPTADKITRESITAAKSRGIPIVSTFDYADEIFPMIDIIRHFRISYFKNTISYMLAYAIYHNYQSLRLDGIDQGPAWVHQQGKSYITFWLGVATGMNVEWNMGSQSLKWAYRVGQDGVPESFLVAEAEKLKCI